MNHFQNVLIFICIVVATACNKMLDAGSYNSSAIKTLTDCQGLLNNKAVFNETPVLGELSADSYYIDADSWKSLSKTEQNAYTWQVDIFEGLRNIPDYSIPYAQVHIANQVIKALPRIIVSDEEQSEKKNIEGAACFLRAYAFYNLLQLFAMPYERTTAAGDYGIAIPVTPDINAVYSRASMKASYDRVITDLLQARRLLTDKVFYDRPSMQAAYAMLARVFLSMRDYVNAGNYADSCLLYYNEIMDYNELDISKVFPVPSLNKEVLYYSNLLSSSGALRWYSIIDSVLYNSYSSNDLRKQAFFSVHNYDQPNYKPSYSGNQFAFSGLATDEVYLIRAECRARANDITGALQDVNTLLKNRYKTGLFQPYVTTSGQETLQLIIEERRKELLFRGLRFTDLRRLNKEGAGIQLRRIANGNTYQLPPNDLRYTMPIPQDAITGSQIVQNPRE